MKKIASFLSLCCLAALPASAPFSKLTWSAGGGFPTPINPIGSPLESRWNAAGGVGMNFNKNYGVMFNFIYVSNGINDTFRNQVLATDGNLRTYGFTLDPTVHVTTEGPVDFYVTGGGGIYHRSVDFNHPV